MIETIREDTSLTLSLFRSLTPLEISYDCTNCDVYYIISTLFFFSFDPISLSIFLPPLSSTCLFPFSSLSFLSLSHLSLSSPLWTLFTCTHAQITGESTSQILKVAIKARSRALGPFHPTFDVNKIITDALDKTLPEDAHERVNGRLHISVTRVSDGKNVILSHFDSKQDLIQVRRRKLKSNIHPQTMRASRFEGRERENQDWLYFYWNRSLLGEVRLLFSSLTNPKFHSLLCEPWVSDFRAGSKISCAFSSS